MRIGTYLKNKAKDLTSKAVETVSPYIQKEAEKATKVSINTVLKYIGVAVAASVAVFAVVTIIKHAPVATKVVETGSAVAADTARNIYNLHYEVHTTNNYYGKEV